MEIATEKSDAKRQTQTPPVTLVYFLGGVTFAEISALRILSGLESHGRIYVVASTHVCNGSTLLESVDELIVNGLDRSSVRKS